eukprot:507945-Rhodomonas_salina.1
MRPPEVSDTGGRMERWKRCRVCADEGGDASGGVEYGFLSTSTSKEEAIVYATSTRDGLAMPVL